MNHNGLMLKCVENIETLEEKYPEFIKHFYSICRDCPDFISNIVHINEDELYHSHIHGILHSEKVLLFATVIGLDEKLNDIEMQIITDAAKYHDIGRTNDHDEKVHGLMSASKIDKVITSEIYKNNNNLAMLKAIVEIHSIDDKQERAVFEKYKLNDFNKFKKMYSILKDADGLDRKRFLGNHPACFDPNYLRLSISKNLTSCAEEINYVYYEIANEKRL